MKRTIRMAAAVVAALTGIALAGHASATLQRTFVASTGVDTNACSITAPCRGFTAAIAKTTAGGEVIALDSAGYGPVTIAKSISLIAPTGVYAGITVFSGDGITVNGPGITVVLRGLSINGQGGGYGIVLEQAAHLRIENCVISNMATGGLLHLANGADLTMLDTIVRDNALTGILVSADTSVVLDHVRSERNAIDGFTMASTSTGIQATITASTFASNGRHGVFVLTNMPSADTFVLIDRSVLADNVANGFILDGTNAGARGSLTRNAIHRNRGIGASVLGGVTYNVYVTMSENAISGNEHGGISADGNQVSLYAGANNVVNYDFPFKQSNGAFFGSHRNNFGGFGASGTISTATGQ
jgi:hypothetical protein